MVRHVGCVCSGTCAVLGVHCSTDYLQDHGAGEMGVGSYRFRVALSPQRYAPVAASRQPLNGRKNPHHCGSASFSLTSTYHGRAFTMFLRVP
jgi:hypothetical protein